MLKLYRTQGEASPLSKPLYCSLQEVHCTRFCLGHRRLRARTWDLGCGALVPTLRLQDRENEDSVGSVLRSQLMRVYPDAQGLVW